MDRLPRQNPGLVRLDFRENLSIIKDVEAKRCPQSINYTFGLGLRPKPVSRLVSADGSLLCMAGLPSVVHNERKARDCADAGKSTKYDINCRKSDSHLCSPPSLSPGGLKV